MSKIENIEKSNRPREKVILSGIKSLSNEELLALIIRCGTKNESALDIAYKVMKEYECFSNLLNADLYDLIKIKGIKKAKAIELMAVLEIGKRITQEKERKIEFIKDNESVYQLVKFQLENEKQELFIVIFLNIKLAIIKKETLFVGGECSSVIDVNLLFKKAMLCGARKIICIHNHPSGDTSPSREDINLTRRIKRIGEVLNIELLDHLIIGKNKYLSLNSFINNDF